MKWQKVDKKGFEISSNQSIMNSDLLVLMKRRVWFYSRSWCWLGCFAIRNLSTDGIRFSLSMEISKNEQKYNRTFSYLQLLYLNRKIGDSVPVLIVILILFAMPIRLNFWCFRSNKDERPKANQAMLTWEFIHDKLPWGLVLLLGNSQIIL